MLLVGASSPFLSILAPLGSLDVLAMTALVCSFALLFSCLPLLIAVLTISAMVLSIVCFNIGSGIYYDHQQDYLPFAYLYLLPEAYAAWQAMSWVEQLAILGSGSMLAVVVSVLTLLVQQVTVRRRMATCCAMLGFVVLSHLLHTQLASFQHSRTVLENQPLGYLLRTSGYLPFVKFDFEHTLARERQAIVARLRGGGVIRLPARFAAARSQMLKTPRFAAAIGAKTSTQTRETTLDSVAREYPGYNVIVIIMESVRASESGLYGASVSATPFLDSLASTSLVARQFYATDGFTAKSEHAINCSLIDFMKGRPTSVRNIDLPYDCLPGLLVQRGYETHWFHGNTSEFYNRAQYLPKLGYQHIHSSDELDPYGTAPKLGWGIADPVLFDMALDRLERAQSPFLATILTVSNHLPFDYSWGIDFPKHLQSDAGYFQRYRRGIYYTDQALKRFFDRFKHSRLAHDTVLVVTGDHGIWTFASDGDSEQVSSSDASISKSEQYYRQPLLIHTPDSRTGYLADRQHSHLDVAPTILALLDLPVPDSFMGLSMLSTQVRQRVIYLSSTVGLSMRKADLACIPSVQCENKVACHRDVDAANPEVQCYRHRPGQDLLLDPTGEPVSLSVSEYLTERALFDYGQIVLQTGHVGHSQIRLAMEGAH